MALTSFLWIVRFSRKDLQHLPSFKHSHLNCLGQKFSFQPNFLLILPQSSTPRVLVRQPSVFFSCFLSIISKDPISRSVGQGFEPHRCGKNPLEPTPNAFTLMLFIPGYRVTQTNKQTNKQTKIPESYHKSQIFKPIPCVLFPQLSAQDWARSCLILPCLDWKKTNPEWRWVISYLKWWILVISY